MTGLPGTRESVQLPGRHLDDSTFSGWVTRRLNPAALLQSTLIILLILIVWPAAFGGRFGMVMVAGQSMEPTYNLGDAIITWRGAVNVGDVILYRIPDGNFGERNSVIHRVTGGNAAGWITRGDNSEFEDPWTPASTDVLGVTKLRIPVGGRVLALMKSWMFVSVVGGLAVLLIAWPDKEAEPQRRGRHRDRA